MDRLTVIGVTLPVGAPSTITAAPEGKDVTFSAPDYPAAGITAKTSTRTTRAHFRESVFMGDLSPRFYG